MTERRIGWTQPLCETCYAAWEVGAGRVPREPVRIIRDNPEDRDPCLICGTPTLIYTRIDPALARHFKHAKVKVAPGEGDA
jgi:hypothetical protein